jgi:chromosomal replication initiator protein
MAIVSTSTGHGSNPSTDNPERGRVASREITAVSRVAQTAGRGLAAQTDGPENPSWARVRKMLRSSLGEDVYSSWFKSMVLDSVDGTTVRVSVPVKFLRSWIQSHYMEQLLACCRSEFAEAEHVDVVVRQPNALVARTGGDALPLDEARLETPSAPAALPRVAAPGTRPAPSASGRTQAGGLEGSPLDPRYTFESFIVGPSNRMAHAAARQVAETVFSDSRGINPLCLHANVGLGKTHLLHAIAWEVKRIAPHAQLLYLTAERFRYQFVEALRSQDSLAFKDRFRNIDILLIDDLEFLSGTQTEQEFDHVINTMLDGRKQVVVASARAPSQIEKLNERMRSRLQRGLVTEITSLDRALRRQVLDRRLAEKQQLDATFDIQGEVLDLLAERLTESGRELEGAITRLHATWQYMKTPVTLDLAETIVRDLVQGIEPRRIKIEDILKVVSRQFGVTRNDLLSPRRHRSVVWPRQIGMYLAKQMTSRSLPEIGRRFGNRDHTTVLHAIRKIDSALGGNARLKDELEELKRQVNQSA